MNSKEEEQVKALYFYSVKSLVVNGVKLDGRAIYDDAQMLFPLKEVVEKLGFEFVGTTILLQDNKPLYPFGYPFAYKINHHHQNLISFRKK